MQLVQRKKKRFTKKGLVLIRKNVPSSLSLEEKRRFGRFCLFCFFSPFLLRSHTSIFGVCGTTLCSLWRVYFLAVVVSSSFRKQVILATKKYVTFKAILFVCLNIFAQLFLNRSKATQPPSALCVPVRTRMVFCSHGQSLRMTRMPGFSLMTPSFFTNRLIGHLKKSQNYQGL